MRTEQVDVCVIGSGAGGSFVARAAAARGLNTLVLEAGPRVRPSEVTHSELEMVPRLYKDGGLFLNTSMDMFILQGECVGGSTFLSNMVLLRAEREIFESWRKFGADVAIDDIMAAYDAVETELGATEPTSSNVSDSTRLFQQGAAELGFQAPWMTKALGDCRGCGCCNIGCSFGSKKSADATHLAWAEADGARVLPLAEVTRVVHRRGKVREAEVLLGADRQPMRVRARVFVIAAGAIGSSTLLLKSGVRRNVGTRLSFNAGSMIAAEFDQPLDAFDADQMTSYVQGNGWIIEATHNPLMSSALTTAGWWKDHGQVMQRSRYMAYAGGLVGTSPVGKVVWSPFFGHEEVRFRMPQQDMDSLEECLRVIIRSFLAAGAKRVILPTSRFQTVNSVAELDAIERVAPSTKQITIGSSHPQGGNPMSDDPDVGVVKSDFSVHGFDNLFVCDASIFPSTVQVNPIDTILAVAHTGTPSILAQA